MQLIFIQVQPIFRRPTAMLHLGFTGVGQAPINFNFWRIYKAFYCYFKPRLGQGLRQSCPACDSAMRRVTHLTRHDMWQWAGWRIPDLCI
jgi:hypothetical protein